MSAKIVYDPTDSGEPSEITVFGQKFAAGKAVTVSDDLAIRLMGNPFFVRKDKGPVAGTEEDAGDGVLRSPREAQLGIGQEPDKGGPARPVVPERDAPAGSTIPGPKPGEPAPGTAAK